MTVKDTSFKERIIKRVKKLDDNLKTLEAQLSETTKPSEEIERRLSAWRGILGMLSDPEEYAEFEKHARRRPLFGGRELDIAPDEASC